MHTLTPFIAVPLPNSIDNHQYLNAKYYENKVVVGFWNRIILILKIYLI